MSEPYEIRMSVYQWLGYDLQAAINKYVTDLAAHAQTEGEPAPAATTTVQTIVKYHDGVFVIVPDPIPAEPVLQPLPKDAKYYRSKDEMAKIAIDAAKAKAGPEPK